MSVPTAATSKLPMRPVYRASSKPNMIIRGLLRVQGSKIALRRSIPPRTRPAQCARRYSSTSAPSMGSPAPQSHASMLATITTDLDKIAPHFEIQPEQIEILKTPTEFYETLKVSLTLLSLFLPASRSQLDIPSINSKYIVLLWSFAITFSLRSIEALNSKI